MKKISLISDKAERILRKQLVELLQTGHAHLDISDALADFPRELRGKRPRGLPYSAWELLEHMRITQWDILEACRNPEHESPSWPEGYWPKTPQPQNDKDWDSSVQQLLADREALVAMVKSRRTELFASLPNLRNLNVLREALLAADHNSYHLGQFVVLRRLLGAWKE